MSKFNPFDPANGYSEEDRVALETKCASLINRAYRNPFPGASLRHDGADNAGIFFAKQLAHIKTKAYDKEFPELSGLKLFPQTSDTDEDYVQGMIRVYNSPICDKIDNYNCSAFYEPSYVIARAYFEGDFY